MDLFIGSIAIVFNIVAIMFKFRSGDYTASLLDLFMVIILVNVFGGTGDGIAMANIASFILSVIFFFQPPRAADFIPQELKDMVEDFNHKFRK